MFCIHIVQRKLGINLHAIFESPAYDRKGLGYSLLSNCVCCEGLELYHAPTEQHS